MKADALDGLYTDMYSRGSESHWYTAWSTWRRMDFQGVLQVPPGNPGMGTFGKQIAVRMAYPPDEQTLNGTNLEDAITNMLGGSGVSGPEAEDQGVRLWWDTEYRPTNPDL